ncbi:uncharacterized protein V2V93DRAFT_370724 [Kockiozyma suomiensis]|uniref:uncharacterized protein n=1 Tax=Kockiozyma suomiensis TaxID=1337062 RepID=UPI003343E352
MAFLLDIDTSQSFSHHPSEPDDTRSSPPPTTFRPPFDAAAAADSFFGPDYSSVLPDISTDYSVSDSYAYSDYVVSGFCEPLQDYTHPFPHACQPVARAISSTDSSASSPPPVTNRFQSVLSTSQSPNASTCSPCLDSITAAAAEEIATSAKRVRRRKNSISEKASLINPDIRPPLNTIGSRKPLSLPELPPGKTKEDLGPEELANYKHVHRLLRNRIAALASREKKRMYIEHLESINKRLEEEKRALIKQIADLEKSASSSGRKSRSDNLSRRELGNPGLNIKEEVSDSESQLYQQVQNLGYYACISQEDFDMLFLSSGLLFFLLYFASSVTYPSLLNIPPLLVPPHATVVQDDSQLSAQIFKILCSSSTDSSQGFIQLGGSSAVSPKKNRPGVWFVTRLGIPDAVREGATLSIITPASTGDFSNNQLPSPPLSETSVRETVRDGRRTRHLTRSSFDETSALSFTGKHGLLEEMEVIVKRRRIFRA